VGTVGKRKENIKDNIECANAVGGKVEGHDWKIKRNVKRGIVGNVN
jgi:hypothetical protein